MRKPVWILMPLLILGLAACAGGPNTKHGNNGAGMQQGSGTERYGTTPNGANGQENQGQNGQAGGNPFENPNSKLSKSRVFFAFDSDNIKDEYKPILNAHAKYLNNHAGAHVRLEGNTDPRGTREYNLALGQRRAKSVAKYLELQGVSTNQITTISYGEERPLVEGNNKQAWAKDRRVHIVYTSKGHNS
jgi:peptidoglycan-associated lipoprotein